MDVYSVLYFLFFFGFFFREVQIDKSALPSTSIK